MDTTVVVTSEIDGEELRATVNVTPEELEKFNQILEENPGMPEMTALKLAKGIQQPKPTICS
jgi:hypothetical protein